jgi:streptogramin lyase
MNFNGTNVTGTAGRRDFLGAALGMAVAGRALAQNPTPVSALQGRSGASVPVRKGRITKLFKSPEGYPNAICVAPEGLWIGEQKTDNACLVDWDGKLLRTVKTDSKNTSGMAWGGGFIWMGANAAPNGIFQTDISARTLSHRQIPLGGGGCHGLQYSEGKLWIAALRLRGILRVDPQTWEPEFLIPYNVPRAHGLAWDNGALWLVTGSDAGAGLIKYDAATGNVLETVRFEEPYPDPHGLAVKDGVMYTCDAGIHPGWPENISTAHGYICRIDFS